jgi:hypothetical protein
VLGEFVYKSMAQGKMYYLVLLFLVDHQNYQR